MKDTAADIYREAFPKAFVGMLYADRLNKYVTDMDVWRQILRDEKYRCSIERKSPFSIPMLIQNYQREERRWREIETPPDRLTTHRTPTINPGEQMNPAQLKDLLSGIDWHKGNHT